MESLKKKQSANEFIFIIFYCQKSHIAHSGLRIVNLLLLLLFDIHPSNVFGIQLVQLSKGKFQFAIHMKCVFSVGSGLIGLQFYTSKIVI